MRSYGDQQIKNIHLLAWLNPLRYYQTHLGLRVRLVSDNSHIFGLFGVTINEIVSFELGL